MNTCYSTKLKVINWTLVYIRVITLEIEIGVAVQSWLWVRLELMIWWLSRLECLNEIQSSLVQIPLRLTFYSYFKEFFIGEYHICNIYIYMVRGLMELTHFSDCSYRRELGQVGILGGNWQFRWGWFFLGATWKLTV